MSHFVYHNGHFLYAAGHFAYECTTQPPAGCRPRVFNDPFTTPSIHPTWRPNPLLPNQLSHQTGQLRVAAGPLTSIPSVPVGNRFCLTNPAYADLQLDAGDRALNWAYQHRVTFTADASNAARVRLYMTANANPPGVLYQAYGGVEIRLDQNTTFAWSNGITNTTGNATFAPGDEYELRCVVLWIPGGGFTGGEYRYGVYASRNNQPLVNSFAIQPASAWEHIDGPWIVVEIMDASPAGKYATFELLTATEVFQ